MLNSKQISFIINRDVETVEFTHQINPLNGVRKGMYSVVTGPDGLEIWVQRLGTDYSFFFFNPEIAGDEQEYNNSAWFIPTPYSDRN